MLFYLSVCDARWRRITSYPVALDGKYCVIFNCVGSGHHYTFFLTECTPVCPSGGLADVICHTLASCAGVAYRG